MIPRIYVDTSVIGGCLDDEFSEWSNLLVVEFKLGIKKVVISDLTLRELEIAPEKVKSIISCIDEDSIEFVFLTDEALKLADRYIAFEAVSGKHIIDAQHIAIATIERVDVLVSWNFKQIVNLDRIKIFNAVNLIHGYQMLEIRTPLEVLHEKEI